MFKVESIDGLSYVEMKLTDIELTFPSICVVLEIKNQGFSARVTNVWIEWANIREFITKSRDISYKSNFYHSIESMSPDEMTLKIEQVNGELISIKYNVSERAFEHELMQLKGSFELESEKLNELRNGFKDVSSQFD